MSLDGFLGPVAFNLCATCKFDDYVRIAEGSVNWSPPLSGTWADPVFQRARLTRRASRRLYNRKFHKAQLLKCLSAQLLLVWVAFGEIDQLDGKRLLE